MKSLFKKRDGQFQSPQFYLMAKGWWVKKMSDLTCGMSKAALQFSLFVFMVVGTVFFAYTALRGLASDQRVQINFETVSTVIPLREYRSEKLVPLMQKINPRKRSALSIYIDSVVPDNGSQEVSIKSDSVIDVLPSAPDCKDKNNTYYKK